MVNWLQTFPIAFPWQEALDARRFTKLNYRSLRPKGELSTHYINDSEV